MYSRAQFARSHNTVFGLTGRRTPRSRFPLLLANALFVFLFLCTPALRAQQETANAIGRVEGNDISVEGGAGAANLGNGVLPSGGNSQFSSFSVSNGSVVTVHVGQARMALAAGGRIDICGPAKFTVLESGGAITLALNFGRMRVQIPATTALRIYTPTIIATPLDIAGAVRDITLGLDLNNSMCVLSTSGAIRLEQQFSGEGLIVPQAGEFFLAAGTMVPVAGAPGSCECTEFAARTAAPPPAPAPSQPVFAQNVPLAAMIPPVISAQPNVAPANTAVAEPAAPRNRVQIGALAHANEMHPVPPAANNAEPPIPDITLPQYTIIVQPLVMSVTPSPLRPPEPAADTALLVRVSRVAPEWEFSGHVESPEFAVDMQRALGQKPSALQPKALPASEHVKKKRGFWGSLKNIFVGSDETRQ